MIYRARNRQMSYGRPIGILMLEEHIPCPPGTVGNPTSFAYPVCYEIVQGADIASLKGMNNPDSLPAFLAAAQRLVDKGVCAVTGSCGLMIVHQDALARALPVPVFLSSLVQLPFLARLFGQGATIGIMASSRNSLTADHLRLASAGSDVRLVLGAMDDCPHFRSAVGEQSGILDFDRVEAEVVAVARDLVAGNPSIRALLFECTDLPPYAAAVQAAVGLPIFDITTLIDTLAASLARRPFVGVY